MKQILKDFLKCDMIQMKEGVNITIREAINKATIQLKMEKIEMPKQKARLLMQFILKKDRQYLIVYDEKKLTTNTIF